MNSDTGDVVNRNKLPSRCPGSWWTLSPSGPPPPASVCCDSCVCSICSYLCLLGAFATEAEGRPFSFASMFFLLMMLNVGCLLWMHVLSLSIRERDGATCTLSCCLLSPGEIPPVRVVCHVPRKMNPMKPIHTTKQVLYVITNSITIMI